MAYAKPNFTDYVGMLEYGNTVTNDLFGVGTIMTITLVIVMSTGQRHGMGKALVYAGFVGFILTILFLIMGLVTEQAAYILMAMMSLPMLIEGSRVVFR